MNTLTLTTALAIAAALVLVAVLLHGLWRERRGQPRQPVASAHPSGHGGASTQAPSESRSSRFGKSSGFGASGGLSERVEPTLGEGPSSLSPSVAHAATAPGEAHEHPSAHGADEAAAGHPDTLPMAPEDWADTAALADDDEASLALRRAASRIDPLIDAIVSITPEGVVSGDAFMAHAPLTRRAGSKPFQMEGLNAKSSAWETPRAGQSYREFQAGVQLAMRNGPLNEIEYSEFVQLLSPLATALNASLDGPDMRDVVARARELDAFASQTDAVLTVILRANTVAWSLGFLQQCARKQGFVPGAMAGRMVIPGASEGEPPVLVLGFDSRSALADDAAHAALREATLSLDVAQTPEAAEPFALWQTVARHLAQDLDATLVDETGAPISLHAFAAIEQELRRLYLAMATRDLAAGSTAARRLFS